jgi:nucleoside-diphosphate-sugar epimerase
LETYGRIFAERSHLDVTVLRLGNVFGNRLNLERPRTHGVVARMLTDLIRNDVITVYGTGTQILSLLHAADCAAAIAAVLAKPATPGAFEVFNISGEDLSVGAIADLLVEAYGSGRVARVPWPLDGSAMARDIHLEDSQFREQYRWAPEKRVVEELALAARQFRPRSDTPSREPERSG